LLIFDILSLISFSISTNALISTSVGKCRFSQSGNGFGIFKYVQSPLKHGRAFKFSLYEIPALHFTLCIPSKCMHTSAYLCVCVFPIAIPRIPFGRRVFLYSPGTSSFLCHSRPSASLWDYPVSSHSSRRSRRSFPVGLLVRALFILYKFSPILWLSVSGQEIFQ
jgi:hypothetical protein